MNRTKATGRQSCNNFVEDVFTVVPGPTHKQKGKKQNKFLVPFKRDLCFASRILTYIELLQKSL